MEYYYDCTLHHRLLIKYYGIGEKYVKGESNEVTDEL